MKAFIIVVLFYSIKSLNGIIRNDITDRCLHLESALDMHNSQQTQLDKRKLLVYARSCKWNKPSEGNKNVRGHSNQWVEVVPILTEYSLQLNDFTNMSYFVRKVTQNDSVCLASKNNEPTISTVCPSPDATFRIELINQKNLKGQMTSLTTFKLKNNAGHCLTVQPGHETLKFTECLSRNDLFQVWSVCRHMGKCDVGLTWSPQQINFPRSLLNPAPETPLDHKIDVIRQTSPSHVHGIINEVLYTVQNALRIYDESDHFVIGTLETFYTHEIMVEAANEVKDICRDTKKECPPCKNEHNIAKNITAWLLLWMKQCNDGSKLFLSSNILSVPTHLFPIHDSTHARNTQNIPEADKSLDLEHVEKIEKGKEKVTMDNKIRNATQNRVTLNPVYNDNDSKIILPQHDETFVLNDTLPLIDIRFLIRPASINHPTNKTT